MDNERRFYTYAYLREDGTPYYIGKGHGYRAFNKAGRKRNPPPRDRILFLKRNLTEEEAFKHEIYMIAVLGRKDLGTGILWNFTDGGEGTSGWVPSEEVREKNSEAHKGKKLSKEQRERISEGKKGKKKSPETRRKMSEVKKGKKLSKEQRERISEGKKGRFAITNGERYRFISPGEEIPEGWWKGRK